jgi:hypothetical protein
MANFQVTEVQKALKWADYSMDGWALAELAESNGADSPSTGTTGREAGPQAPDLLDVRLDPGKNRCCVPLTVRRTSTLEVDPAYGITTGDY